MASTTRIEDNGGMGGEEVVATTDEPARSNVKRLHSSHDSGMESEYCNVETRRSLHTIQRALHDMIVTHSLTHSLTTGSYLSFHSPFAGSVLRFKNVNFTVGKGDNEKHIIQDVSGTVKFGRKSKVYSVVHTVVHAHCLP